MKSGFGLSAIASVLIFFGAIGAQAYIPPAPFIVGKIAAKHGGIKGIRIKSVVNALEYEHPTGAHFKVVTIFSSAADSLRSYAYNDAGVLLYAVERNPVSTALTPALLLEPNESALAESLKRAKVSDETTRLQRWNGAIAWVIGKKDGPQLWVEKDTFLPIRMVSGELSVDFYKYYFYREFPVPRMADVVQGKSTVLQDEVSEVAVNPDLKEFRAPISSSGLTAAGESSSGAVKELLKKYYELLR